MGVIDCFMSVVYFHVFDITGIWVMGVDTHIRVKPHVEPKHKALFCNRKQTTVRYLMKL